MASTPARSRRGNILRALQRQLESITTGNGYTHTLKTVTTAVKSWSSLTEPECPIVFIIDDETNYKYNPGTLGERSWTIQLMGVMKNETQIDMEELIADIEECLVSNERLRFADDAGQVCNHIRIKNIVTDNQLFSEIEGSQLFKVTLEVNYTVRITSIR